MTESTCPNCDSSCLATEYVEQECEHGEVRYTAEFPVRRCLACDLQFLDYICEQRKHEALCRSQGLLIPAEIRQIREAHGSVEELSEKSGIEVAKLRQLENGVKLQTQAEDKLFRFLYMLRQRL